MDIVTQYVEFKKSILNIEDSNLKLKKIAEWLSNCTAEELNQIVYYTHQTCSKNEEE